MRYENWKMVFCEQRAQGTLRDLGRAVHLPAAAEDFNLRMDPYERADITSNTYYDWSIRRVVPGVPAQALVAQFMATFKEFPPRQRPSSFSVDQIMEQMQKAHGG